MPSIGILGTGNMGQALIKGWADKPSLEILGYDLEEEKLREMQDKGLLKACHKPAELITRSDYLILAVKPKQISALLKEQKKNLNSEQCLVSIAAGVSLDKLSKYTEDRCPLVRVMPNTPALVGKGIFALCFDNPKVIQDQKDFLISLFSAVGQVHVLEEGYFDAFTALIGSGPAYVFYFMEALIDAGITLGLTRKHCLEMIPALLEGSLLLAENSENSISQLREMVSSPAGTTIEGLNHLDRQAVRASLIDSVQKAFKRSKKLG